MSDKMDEMDRKILSRLQKDASQSVDEVSAAVGLSRNACWRRIRMMEEAGIITRRVALVDATKVRRSQFGSKALAFPVTAPVPTTGALTVTPRARGALFSGTTVVATVEDVTPPWPSFTVTTKRSERANGRNLASRREKLVGV